MKFTLSWLREHLATEADLPAIADKLTALGLEVEGIEDPGAVLAPFTVGHVKSAEPHPDADRLRVCVVETKFGEVQVVCGAPNARAGMKGAFAPAGSHIPGTGLDLKKGVIRGVESNGMLCSEREMGLSDEHQGIIELPDHAAVGMPVAEVLGLNDPVIDIALTPDRGDCAGVRGIARDLAAAGLGTLKPLAAARIEGRFPSTIGVRFDFPAGAGAPCPLFAGRLIRGVRNGPSPKWLQDRLRSIGLRPISALVDITNFFTMDRARPLHVFDADLVKGDLVLRLSRPGETLDALNDRSYTVETDQVTIIADDSGAVSFAGVVGGVSTGTTGDTVNVFLEAALFDPERTAETGRALGIDSDARYRFERGVDPEGTIPGIEQATAMILELCGGEPSALVVTGAVPEWRRRLTLRTGRAAALGGLDVPADRQRRHLEALGCQVEAASADSFAVVPPSWRPDIEGEADLVEEVLRIEGFDAIEPVSLPRLGATTAPAVDARQKAASRVKRALAARGLSEAVTWSFMDSRVASRFGFQSQALRLVNPISSDLDVMRPSALANLIQAAGRNVDRGLANPCLFEVGPVYRDATEKGQLRVAASVRQGMTGPRHWAAAPRPVDVFDAKSDALAALEAAGGPAANAQVTTDAPDWFHPGRSGVLRLGANVLAHFGEIHPAVLEALDVAGPVAAAEVFLDAVPVAKKKPGSARPKLDLSAFQPVSRDFAFVLDADEPADKLVRAAIGGDKALVSAVSVFDVYQGAGVPEGKKSIAIQVTLQPRERTLTDEEIEAVARKIVANVEKQTGATLRG
ncbi:MAG: phenylalanine--tRNA ligase subunit beta [Azospirillaceae bacterium]